MAGPWTRPYRPAAACATCEAKQGRLGQRFRKRCSEGNGNMQKRRGRWTSSSLLILPGMGREIHFGLIERRILLGEAAVLEVACASVGSASGDRDVMMGEHHLPACLRRPGHGKRPLKVFQLVPLPWRSLEFATSMPRAAGNPPGQCPVGCRPRLRRQ